jgi:hypothetical protein
MSKLYRLSTILAVLMFLVIAPMALAQTGDTGTDQTNPTDASGDEANADQEDADTDATQMTQTSAATDTNTAAGDNGTTVGTDVEAQGTDATVDDQTDTGKLGQDPQAQSGQQDQAGQDVLLPETGGAPSSWPSLLLLTAGAVFVVTGLLSLSFARRSR